MKKTTQQSNGVPALFQTQQQTSVNEILQTYKDKIVSYQSPEKGKALLRNPETTQLVSKSEESSQKVPNNTGLPDNLKSGVENLSGYSMDDVKVHYNSSQPATLQAHAFAQGTDIHIGPGQEKHLPHEAWHVVQQKQGRVKPTMQMKGKVDVNDDVGLEKEADVMGDKALHFRNNRTGASEQVLFKRTSQFDSHQNLKPNSTLQMMWPDFSAIGSALYSGGAHLVSATMAHPYIAGGAALSALGLSYLYKNWGVLKGPKKGQKGLEDLPQHEMWRMFINPKDHQKASTAAIDGNIPSPGDYYRFYDEKDERKDVGDTSTAFQDSMMEAIQQELFFKGGHLGRKVDYKEYERLHNLVTGKFRSGRVMDQGSKEDMRTRSSVEQTVSFPIQDWGTSGERNNANLASDIESEVVDNLPLVYRWQENDGHIQEGDKGITLKTPDGRIAVNYTEEQGVEIVQKILDQYYNDIKAAKTPDEKINVIVKVIRALHVTHPFKDANGRLHGQLLLNKFLLEQGFNPTILGDKGLGIFGGGVSLADLKQEVELGMNNFQQLTESKKMK